MRWTVSVDQQDHQVIAENRSFRMLSLKVDDQPIPVRTSFMSALTQTDIPFLISDKECRFIKVANKMDLVVNGRYLSNQQLYFPPSKTPWWTWIFIAGYVLMFMLGGFVPILGALLGFTYTFRTVKDPNRPTLAKVLTSLGLEFLFWLIVYTVAFIIFVMNPTH